jgi:tripartite-type tricarboxylate transporter receptor subunit TctC
MSTAPNGPEHAKAQLHHRAGGNAGKRFVRNSANAKLNAAVVDALADATVGARLAELGQAIFPREQPTPDALSALYTADTEKWWPIVKAANIKAE